MKSLDAAGLPLPAELPQHWHESLSLLPGLLGAGTALVARLLPDCLQVVASAAAEETPYQPGLQQALQGPLFAAQVVASGQLLQVADARDDPAWAGSPDLELGVVAYLGTPLRWPDGRTFGCLSVLDHQPRVFEPPQLALIAQLAQGVERDLALWMQGMRAQQLEQRCEQLAAALDLNPAGVLLLDADGQVLLANARMAGWCGVAPQALQGCAWEDLGEDFITSEQISAGSEQFELGASWVREFTWRHADGTPFWARSTVAPVMDAAEELRFLVETVEDVSLLKDFETELVELAAIDPLTGLPNRKLALDFLIPALAHARRQKSFTGVLGIDLDDFGEINEALGEDAGDEVLVETARRLRACLRETDTVATLGGNEYLAIITDLRTPEDALTVAELVRGMLSEPYLFADTEIEQTCTIGIAVFPGDGEQPQELMERAVIALYRAKAHGQGGVMRFEADEA